MFLVDLGFLGLHHSFVHGVPKNIGRHFFKNLFAPEIKLTKAFGALKRLALNKPELLLGDDQTIEPDGS